MSPSQEGEEGDSCDVKEREGRAVESQRLSAESSKQAVGARMAAD